MCQNAKCQKLQWTVWELADAGNHAIYGELVKRRTATANQLGSWFSYKEGEAKKMKRRAHQSCLITRPAEMLS